ncbi:MAG: hypothetical protein SNG14_00080 [Rikenellaceae bacterium]
MNSGNIEAAWYLPNHIALWQETAGEGVSAITELLVLNHPEAVAQSESVDFALLTSLFAEDQGAEREKEADVKRTDEAQPQLAMGDIMAAIASSSSGDTALGGDRLGSSELGGDRLGSSELGGDRLGGEASDLIDKFLGLKDLRIVAECEPTDEQSNKKEVWQEVEMSELHNFADDASSEELAAIYLSQGLFDEAKEIYNRLFLLYSEKSVYFAEQIDKIDRNRGNNN